MATCCLGRRACLEEKITNLTFASSILHLEASLMPWTIGPTNSRARQGFPDGRPISPGGAPDFGLASPDRPAESQPLEMLSPAIFFMR